MHVLHGTASSVMSFDLCSWATWPGAHKCVSHGERCTEREERERERETIQNRGWTVRALWTHRKQAAKHERASARPRPPLRTIGWAVGLGVVRVSKGERACVIECNQQGTQLHTRSKETRGLRSLHAHTARVRTCADCCAVNVKSLFYFCCGVVCQTTFDSFQPPVLIL